MESEIDQAFESYSTALDQCIELSKQRAFMSINDEFSASEALKLDVQYMRATLNCQKKREAWVKVRDARFEEPIPDEEVR